MAFRSEVTDSLSLIGMPGSGKSTLGLLLAQKLKLNLIDTDRLIEQHTGTSLQAYLDQYGVIELRRVEEEIILQMPFRQAIIATGGSVVYSDAVMQRLACRSSILFLDITYETMVARLGDHSDRGLAIFPGSSLLGMYQERRQLYEQYAHRKIDAEQPIEVISREVIDCCRRQGNLQVTRGGS